MIADIIAFIILLFCIIIGIKCGFTAILMKLVSLAVSIWVAVVLYNPFMNLIYAIPATASVAEALKHFIAMLILPALGGDNFSIPQVLTSFINPDVIIQGKQQIALSVAGVITSAIFMLILIILIKLAVYFLSGMLKIVTKLPVIKQANKFLGAIAGFAFGICICYITSLVIFMLQSSYAPFIDNLMNGSFLMDYFMRSNALINVIIR